MAVPARPLAVPSKNNKKSATKPPIKEDQYIFDKNHDQRICQIPATSNEPRLDPFVYFKPKPNEYANYSISQVHTAIDGGDTKLRIIETNAEYEPHPPGYEPLPANALPPQKKHKSRGRGPLKELLEEKWARLMVEQQAIHQEMMFKRQKSKRELLIADVGGIHQTLSEMVGPDWYQELSPKQKITVSNLGKCILLDTKLKTITNCQENIANLGLVLRPNHTAIAAALKHCCFAEVEFLLILYQLINPNRTAYSVNDRLLLSAVVHLTIMDTFKELHIRIPSPPRNEAPRKRKVEWRPRKLRYSSPYLEPFTFEREKPKHTGIFKKSHLEWPRSPYFEYMEELKKNQAVVCIEDTFEEQENGEWYDGEEEAMEEDATTVDNESLQEGTNVEETTPLPRRKRKLNCGHCTGLEEDGCGVCRPLDECRNEDYNTVYAGPNTCVEAPPTFEEEPSTEVAQEKAESVRIEEERTEEEDVPEYFNELEDAEHKLYLEWQNAQEEYNKLAQTKCVSVLYKPSIFYPCDNVFRQRMRRKEQEKNKEGMEENEGSKQSTNTSADSSVVNDTASNAKAKIENTDKSLNNDNESKKNVTPHSKKPNCPKTASKTSSASICESKQGSTEKECLLDVCNNPNQADDIYNSIRNYEVGKTLEVTAARSQECTCSEAIKKRVLQNLCQCKRCIADREDANKRVTRIIKDTKVTTDGEILRIIDDLKTKKICTCMEKYEEKVQRHESKRAKLRAQTELKSIDGKFIVRGTAISPEGKLIYILEGVSPKRSCPCAAEKLAELEEAKRIANMPKLPDGRQKYRITGVHARPEGNIYVIESAIPIEDCDCMDLYTKYTQPHTICLRLYDEFLKKIKYDTDAYMAEVAADSRFIEFEPANECDCAPCPGQELDDDDDEEEDFEEGCGCEGELMTESDDSMYFEEPTLVKCACVNNGSNTEPDADAATDEDLTLVEEDQPTTRELSRYIILDKIPCEPLLQMAVVKQALEKMADDGYPLAKLPDVYKLPHFRLWMQKRCGKFWTQEEKGEYMKWTRKFWEHMIKCHRSVRLPKLELSDQEGSKYTWQKSKHIKKLTGAIKHGYYRKLKQAQIDGFREMYPSLYCYEFPTQTFADVCFSYSPAKEEECFSYRMWKPFEFRDMETLRKCKN